MKSPYPLISVLIPVYNVEAYVEKAIESVIQQTYENLEIIVVDDCSTDNTLDIVRRMAEKDKRVFLYKNDKNKKIVETLNFAFNKSTGALIARMDGDDISAPARIEKQLEYMAKNPGVDLVGVNVVIIDEEDNIIHNESYIEKHEDIVKASKYVSPIPHFWLAKRTVYETLEGYRIPTVEDYDFILRSIDKGFILANHPEYLYKQRIRKGNTATALGFQQYKLRKYIRKLSAERKSNNGKENYDENSLATAMKECFFEEKRFSVSSRMHFNYNVYKNKNIFISIYYRMFSVVISPIAQIEQIYQRWQYKRLKKHSY